MQSWPELSLRNCHALANTSLGRTPVVTFLTVSVWRKLSSCSTEFLLPQLWNLFLYHLRAQPRAGNIFFILGFSLNSASQSQHDGTPHVAAISVWLPADDSVKIWADVLKPRSSMWKFFWKLAESRKLSWNLMQPLAGGEQPLPPLDVMLLPVPSRLKLWALCAQWIGY